MQGGDFLVAGLREPAYGVVFLMAAGLMWLTTWPERVRRRDPARAARWQGHWWTPIVLPPRTGFYSWWGMRPDTVAVLGVILSMLSGAVAHATKKAERARAGRGTAVEVTLSGAAAPLAGRSLLLGTTTAFAFVYWPETQRIEAIGLESIARIRTPGPATGSGR